MSHDRHSQGDPCCHGNDNKRVVNVVIRLHAGEVSAPALLRLVWVKIRNWSYLTFLQFAIFFRLNILSVTFIWWGEGIKKHFVQVKQTSGFGLFWWPHTRLRMFRFPVKYICLSWKLLRVLRKQARGVTLTDVEAQFQTWCDTQFINM